MTQTESAIAVELRGITKRFGKVVANDSVNLRIARGSIHGIVGENGAGKSTAMKLLYGLCQPDGGEILVRGKSCRWSTPRDAIAAGIGMVHQHFMLAGPHSVLENIILGAEGARFGMIDRTRARDRIAALGAQYGLQADGGARVEDLPVGIQQRIEILKLLYRDADILILDEPTGVLTPQEANRLFENLGRMRAQGKTIIFVTHKLKEIMAFTDRVSVFRAGKVLGEVETAKTNPQELADMMVGRKVILHAQAELRTAGKEVGIEGTDLTLKRAGDARARLSDVNLEVRCGEIVGIAGVEGNGQSELIQALLHPADRLCRTSGQVRILGQDVTNWSARRIRDLGVAMIPEDRLHEGLLLSRSLSENFLLGKENSQAAKTGPFLDSGKIRQAAATALAEYDVRPANLDLPASALSGGNQQKLIAAREFSGQPKVLIVAQPTRGVDVGAIEFIHKRIVHTRDAGAAVLLISSELDEIIALSDRVLVMYEGRIVAEFRRGQMTEAELGLKMGGA